METTLTHNKITFRRKTSIKTGLVSAEWQDLIEIRVCEDSIGDKCTFCGNPPAGVAGSSWATVTCIDGPITGIQLRFANPFHHLQFCEMKIYGFG